MLVGWRFSPTQLQTFGFVIEAVRKLALFGPSLLRPLKTSNSPRDLLAVRRQTPIGIHRRRGRLAISPSQIGHFGFVIEAGRDDSLFHPTMSRFAKMPIFSAHLASLSFRPSGHLRFYGGPVYSWAEWRKRSVWAHAEGPDNRPLSTVGILFDVS